MRQLMRQTELSPELINDTRDERCSRGIELFATRDALVRHETAKAALIESVLREHSRLSATMPSVDAADEASEKHRIDAMKDATAQAVCEVSTRLSLEARSRAATLGASDRAFAAVEESGLRALLASHNLASPAAQTDVSLATRGYARLRSESSAQPTNTSRSAAAGSSSPSSSLKRSACSVPNMMNYAASHHGPSTSAAMVQAVQAYEQVATHRRRRLSLLRENMLASMVISDNSSYGRNDNTAQHLQQHQQQQHRS